MDADGRARRLATRHDGVIGVRALLACGLTRRQIRLRVASEELIQVHPGVFLVGGAALGFRARVRAALLACGPTAFASNWTAAVLWRIRRWEPDIIDITVIGAHRRHLDGVRVHRLRTAVNDQLRDRGGFRVSSPARTICELAASAARRDVEYAIQEAAAQTLLTPEGLRAAADRWAPRPGAVLLRALLEADGNVEFSRSWAERRLRWIIDRAGLPRPEQNRHVLGHRVDAVWPEARLVVEADGLGTHGTAVAFAADRAMDAELTAGGWRVLRFTATQLRDEPLLVATRIAAALALAA